MFYFISIGSGQIQLWQFLLELLSDSSNSGKQTISFVIIYFLSEFANLGVGKNKTTRIEKHCYFLAESKMKFQKLDKNTKIIFEFDYYVQSTSPEIRFNFDKLVCYFFSSKFPNSLPFIIVAV